MEKPFNQINMGVKKKKSPRPNKQIEKVFYASRVLPFLIAYAGADVIKALPLITRIENNADIELLLRKRKRVLREIVQEYNELKK